nr:MAG TPA: hypothetical protein [Caudoviricetes sp.]
MDKHFALYRRREHRFFGYQGKRQHGQKLHRQGRGFPLEHRGKSARRRDALERD